jgi:hypothetical protein
MPAAQRRSQLHISLVSVGRLSPHEDLLSILTINTTNDSLWMLGGDGFAITYLRIARIAIGVPGLPCGESGSVIHHAPPPGGLSRVSRFEPGGTFWRCGLYIFGPRSQTITKF